MWKINTVKKLILFAFASLVIVSCRKDDDDLQIKSSFEGNWNYIKKQIMSGKDNSILFSEAITDCPEKRSYQFSNHNYTLTIFKDNFVGSCVVDEIENGTFSYDDSQNNITFKSSRTNNQYSINVNSINNNELQLADPFFGYDANNDGIADKFVLVFNK